MANPSTRIYTPALPPQLTLLDGVAFKDKGGEGRLLGDEELRACFRLSNHKDDPLLAYKTAAGGQGAAKGASRQGAQIRLENGCAAQPPAGRGSVPGSVARVQPGCCSSDVSQGRLPPAYV
jgi:hypothetical protein